MATETLFWGGWRDFLKVDTVTDSAYQSTYTVIDSLCCILNAYEQRLVLSLCGLPTPSFTGVMLFMVFLKGNKLKYTASVLTQCEQLEGDEGCVSCQREMAVEGLCPLTGTHVLFRAKNDKFNKTQSVLADRLQCNPHLCREGPVAAPGGGRKNKLGQCIEEDTLKDPDMVSYFLIHLQYIVHH